MSSGRHFASCLVVALCLAGCSSPLPARYVENANAASAAYSAGRYLLSAKRWSQAAAFAPDDKHRGESRYRQATSLWKGGRLKAAKLLFRELKSRSGPRQARASFDYAYLCLDNGNIEEGYSALRNAVVSHPKSGNLDRALRLLTDWAQSTKGADGALAFLQALEQPLSGTDGEQALRYFRARLLEETHQSQLAIREYQLLVKRFPYPQGSYWDDATLRAVELLLGSSQTDQAVAMLRDMVLEREGAAIVGSYERQFSTAHFRLAELYRDNKNDWKRARSEFRRVFELYDSSLLRDDALWEACLLSLKHSEPEEACIDMKRLRGLPESRFGRCATAVCDSLPADDLECPAYLQTEIAARGRM